MKKFICILILSLSICPCSAQFNVHSDGSASVIAQDADYALSGSNGSYGVKGLRTSYNTSDWGYGIYGESQNFYTLYSVGVAGIATTSSGNRYNYGRAYGVWGEAKLAENGYNYGVFGKLSGTEYGSAIYGTIVSSDNGVQISGKYAGYFNGPVYVNGNVSSTDIYSNTIMCDYIYASNISSVSSQNTLSINGDTESVSDKVARLSAVVTYDKNNISLVNSGVSSNSSSTVSQQGDIRYSLSAEQMEEVFPELVYTNADGTTMTNYTELIPLLVQCIAELKAEIAILKGTSAGNVLSKARSSSTNIPVINNEGSASIAQNSPNPWSSNTEIVFHIPEGTVNAFLCFYDLKGNLVLSQEVSQRGDCNAIFTSADFASGVYLYTLILDGKATEAKRMIVED